MRDKPLLEDYVMHWLAFSHFLQHALIKIYFSMTVVLKMNNVLQPNDTDVVRLWILSDSVWLLVFGTETLGAL